MKQLSCLLLLFAIPFLLVAQQPVKENLGDKEYVIVKDYKPVLGESLKLSETPEGDTSSSVPPVLEYDVRAKKASADYEASVIKAVSIKDEQLAKLYRTYVRLGIGNYTTYLGDLYVNALRSKQGAAGLALNHHSGNPGFSDAGAAGFSKNHAGLYGKYFLENSTFTGNVDYNRDVVHFYGYDTDTVIEKNKIKQRFNRLGLNFGLASNYLTRDNLDYAANFGYSTLSDFYDVTENDFLLSGKAGKEISDYYLNADVSFNYFKKTRAKGEIISLSNDLKRSIISAAPTLKFIKEKFNLDLGFNFSVEKNKDTKVRLFPKINISVPIAENILYVFAGANGNVIKNSYQTIIEENPFVSSVIQPLNSVNKLELKGGLNGNFSQRISFMAMVKYSSIDNMLLYINDTTYFNKFNVLYVNGSVLDVHAEVSYNSPSKFTASLKFDQYSYKMTHGEKAWHRPGMEVALTAGYNIWDKILVNAAVYGYGSYYVRQTDTLTSQFTSDKVNGFADINLGLEYRYSKILSIFLNFNNLGFAKYYRWYNYPTEKFNMIGGIKVSF